MNMHASTAVQMPAFDPSRVLDVDLYGAVKKNPYEYYVKWAQSEPFYIMVDGYPQAVFARYDDTRAVLTDYARFSSVKNPWPGTQGFYFSNSLPTVTDSDPPAHTRRRILMAPAFSPRALAKIEEGVQTYVDTLLTELEGKGGAFDLVADMAKPLSLHVLFSLVFNFDENARAIFVDMMNAMRAAFSTPQGDPSKMGAYKVAWDRFGSFCAEYIEERRKTPTDDLVSRIIAAHDVDGKITSDEMFATLFILYTAGIGGLINFPAWTLWRLARHQDQLALLQKDPALLDGALAESLRMDPSSYASLRYATGDFEFAGIQLFKGMPVHTLSASGNYDPKLFPDPLTFNIRRGTDWKNLTSFGHGVHHCIGNALARMTTRICVGKFVQRFPRLRLESEDFMPEIEGVLKQRSPVAIPVRVD
jgi:cytochrome P450